MIKRLFILLLILPFVGAQITVENNAPLFDPLEDKFIEQNPFTYYLKASDLDGGTLTFSSDNDLFYPNMVSKTEGIIQFLPSVEKIGIYNVNFEVSDGELSDYDDVTFIILPQKFSTKFSVDKSSLDLIDEERTTLNIKNLEEDPLYVLVDTPNFIRTLSAVRAEADRDIVLQTDGSENIFGMIKISSPKSLVNIPLFVTSASNFECELNIIELSGLSIGRDTQIDYSISKQTSEKFTDVKLTATLFSHEGSILTKRITSISFEDLNYNDTLSLTIPSDLEEGTYGLILTLNQADKTAVAYQSIELTKSLQGIPISTINYGIILVVTFLFLKLIRHNRHHLRKIHRVHKKHSLFLKKHKVSKTKEDQLRKKLSTLERAYALGSITKKTYLKAKSHFYRKIKRVKRDQVKI